MNKDEKILIRKLIVVVRMLAEESKRDYLKQATEQLLRQIEKKLKD